MSWSKENFLQVPDGENLFRCRQIMASFMRAMASGYIGNYLPSPGYGLKEEQVRIAIRQIDNEWEKEWKGRGRDKSYTGGPKFSSLPLLQQIALVEQLRMVLYGKS